VHNEHQRVLEAEQERFTQWVAESEASAPGRGHAGWDEPRLGLLERLATRLRRRRGRT